MQTFVNVSLSSVLSSLLWELVSSFLAGPECALKNRLKMHLANRFHEDDRLLTFHQKLRDNLEDQVT